MRYYKQALLPNEEVLAVAEMTKAVLIWPIVFTVITFGIFVPLTAIWFIIALIQRNTSDFAVTDRRLIVKYGLIRRTSIEQRLNKIDSIIIRQGFWGRLFNYGYVVATGSGLMGSKFGPLGDPMAFKMAIEKAIDAQGTT